MTSVRSLRLPDTIWFGAEATASETCPLGDLALLPGPWGASSFGRHLPILLAEAYKQSHDGVEMYLLHAASPTMPLAVSHGRIT